jgi:hypothetical protein
MNGGMILTQGKIKVLGENLVQLYFDYSKSQTRWPWIERDPIR